MAACWLAQGYSLRDLFACQHFSFPLMNQKIDDGKLTTALFCRSTHDGVIAPHWSPSAGRDRDDAFVVGSTIAERYALLDAIGEGAMGRVFLAKDLRLDR